MKKPSLYLRRNIVSFWNWVAEERSIAWLDGRTITFSEELLGILSPMSERGFPDFDCVVLLLASLRDNWCTFYTSSDQDTQLLNYFSKLGVSNQTSLELLGCLDRLHSLPTELRHSLEARRAIVEMVLELMPIRCDKADTQNVLRGLRQEDDEIASTLLEYMPTMESLTLSADLAALSASLSRFDEAKLRRRLKTGLDEDVLPTEEAADKDEEYSDSIEARELIDNLVHQSEWSGLGLCAKNLLAALYQPAPLRQYDTLHSEGWSDISNQGTIDRLLLSELAYDNEMLAIRILHGESLYLRRDTPPTLDREDRYVFVECGVGTWGVARWYTTSVAMALTASASPNAKVFGFRGTPSGELTESYFTDESGLHAHLACLATTIHPGKLLREFAERSETGNKLNSRYLVVSRNAWEHNEFQLDLAKSTMPDATIAIVDRHGKLELLRWTPRGTRSIKQLTMNIQAARDANSIVSSARLPSILQAHPLPFRIAIHNAKFHLVDLGILLGSTPSRRLYVWDDPRLGAIDLGVRMEPGRIQWAGLDDVSNSLLIVWRLQTGEGRYLIVRCKDYHLQGVYELGRIDEEASFCIMSGALIMSHRRWNTIQAFRPSTTSWICKAKLAKIPTAAVELDGNSNLTEHYFNGLGFERRPIAIPSEVKPTEMRFMGRLPRNKGYFWLSDSGLLFTNIQRTPLVARSPQSLPIEDDSRRYEVQILGDNRWIAIQKDRTTSIFQMSEDGSALLRERTNLKSFVRLTWPEYHSFSSHSFRNRFQHVGLVHGQLTLRRNGSFMTLTNQNGNLQWMHKTKLQFVFDNAVALELDHSLDKELGIRIERATQNQVEILLDGRGLLHLRSLKDAIPEITLVIQEGQCSGYVSDGRCFGIKFHHGNNNVLSSNHEVIESVLKPLLEEWSR